MRRPRGGKGESCSATLLKRRGCCATSVVWMLAGRPRGAQAMRTCVALDAARMHLVFAYVCAECANQHRRQ
ncbi:hypothetical protein XHV734_1239 [Xanthomonas hortorum pv. vitians]|nr:hypothetical protein XHV734_1239 [Xanthomonas hortorum pv. vitians]